MKNWNLHQLDVNNVFSMEIPQRVKCEKSNQVCKLKKYCLEQASRKWYEKLTLLLLTHGYKQSSSDYSLFTNRNGENFTTLLVYVDDVILGRNCLKEF